jgi:deoxyhypusine synthase
MEKRELLSTPVEHVDITSFDSTAVIEAMRRMSFASRETAQAADIFERMLEDPACSVILTLAGSTSAAGCMQVYADMVRYNMVDAIVATGASIVDMDFFEALGFRHYQGSPHADDRALREMYVDRIYDTYIDEEQLQACDRAVKEIADGLPARPYSSREFIREMGRYLKAHAKKKDSLVECAFDHEVPIFCPAFSDSSAGFGLVLHQVERGEAALSIDSVKDFRELTEVKISAGTTGLFMVGGGAPKNFAQDTVVCAEVLGRPVEMHRYAVQITVADVRDGACSSSTLREANSWGKVDSSCEQMVYAEATTVVPLIASYAYHRGAWRRRERRAYSRLFDVEPAARRVARS